MANKDKNVHAQDSGHVLPEQAWYWTAEWQKRECEAEADLASGRYRDFASMDDFIASLDDDSCPQVNSASGGETNESHAESARVTA